MFLLFNGVYRKDVSKMKKAVLIRNKNNGIFMLKRRNEKKWNIPFVESDNDDPEDVLSKLSEDIEVNGDLDYLGCKTICADTSGRMKLFEFHVKDNTEIRGLQGPRYNKFSERDTLLGDFRVNSGVKDILRFL